MELALATELCEKRNKGLIVNLTLDGLKVTVKLDYSEIYSLQIESQDTEDILYEIEDEEVDIVGLEAVSSAIVKMRDTLDQLCYNKLLGKFVLNGDKGNILIHKVFKRFLNVEDCSICFEETTVTTNCKHHCCHRCMEKIKLCPICRRDLYD
jgi:hypothetical protein